MGNGPNSSSGLFWLRPQVYTLDTSKTTARLEPQSTCISIHELHENIVNFYWENLNSGRLSFIFEYKFMNILRLKKVL